MRKKELALEVIERLKKEYPDADCTLDYDEAWKLLVGVRLAAQCTDERVNIVVGKLYEKYPDVNALAAADVDKIEEIVRPCGLKLSNTAACVFISFNRVSISLSPTLTLPILSFSALGASPNAFSASLARPLISMLDGSALTLTLLSMALFKALFISSVNPSIFTLSMADLASSFAFEVALLLRESFWLDRKSVV